MPRLIVRDRTGRAHEIAAAAGLSVMENIREAGLDELLALCGGGCSCATCHVYVADEWLPQVGAAVGDEDDLLDSSEARNASSRLSCQIEMSQALDGLTVTIAPED